MQKAFEKIAERLEEKKEVYKKIRKNTYCRSTETDDCDRCIADKKLENRLDTINDVIEIVNKVAEEYKDFEIFTKEQLANIEQMNVNTFERLVKLNKTNDGWIPCVKLVPVETDEDLAGDYLDHLDELIEQGVFKPYLVTIEGAKVPTELYYVGYAGEALWYDEITEEFYKVIAWQELPPVYQPKGK